MTWLAREHPALVVLGFYAMAVLTSLPVRVVQGLLILFVGCVLVYVLDATGGRP